MNPHQSLSGKTVALADTRWHGHHPTYLREFATSLLRIGARVILACREPDEIIRSLPDGPFGDLDSRVFGIPFKHRNQGVINPTLDHDPASTLLRWHATGRVLANAERDSGWNADLVFFCYLDSYLRFAPFPRLPDFFIHRPWSGLYFRNAHLGQYNDGDILRRAAKGDKLLSSPSCRAVCVLDERFNDILAANCGNPVISFPDITDETIPAQPTQSARTITEKAAGRKIIGLVSMERRKGLLTLLRTAVKAHQLAEPWFFVATGPFPKETFSTDELAFCDHISRRIATGELDNIHFDTSGNRIPDGIPYNSVFSAFDLVWAAYEGFQGSSNALTKAAAFRIPVLATAGECIGDRVVKYRLGHTIPQADVDACLAAIRATLADTGPDGEALAPRFGAYHALHSRNRLDEVFARLLSPESAAAHPAPPQGRSLTAHCSQ